MKYKVTRYMEYFSKGEKVLWFSSVLSIILSFMIFDRQSYLILSTSLIGTTSLIFTAKGNPFGQLLMIIFSILYGIVSFTFDYYGEMITYLGMTGPMALLALISWLRNPYNDSKLEIKINSLLIKEIILMILLTVIVTVVFYYILDFFNTNNIFFSTVSVSTSFLAVYLTFMRSRFYAIAYAVNDLVLIILWILATVNDNSYFSVVICFIIFFINDIYGYINWSKIKKRQKKESIDI